MKSLTFRLADQRDVEPLSQWVGESTQIPIRDVQASLKENSPTSVMMVIEDEEGKTILAAPTYAVAMLGFIIFNPEASGRERIHGLEALKGAAQAFWASYGVTEINTLTHEHYQVAQWAQKHGFELEPRKVLRLVTPPTVSLSN